MNIVILCFDDFTDIDVFLPWDLLNRVRLVAGIKEWHVKLVGTKKNHHSSAGLTIPMSGDLDDIQQADAVLIASGSGIQKLIRDEVYLSHLKMNPENQLIGSMCSGALLLGALGLLTGKTATTYPSVADQLRQYGVEVIEKSFVNQATLSTAAGCFAAQELVSWMIRTLLDQEVVNKVMESVMPVGKTFSSRKRIETNV